MGSAISLTRGPVVGHYSVTRRDDGGRAHIDVGGVTLMLSRSECDELAMVLQSASKRLRQREVA